MHSQKPSENEFIPEEDGFEEIEIDETLDKIVSEKGRDSEEEIESDYVDEDSIDEDLQRPS
jgi:hypothetical protein